MDEVPKLKINKAEAAKSQLETAIKLWFNNDDPVSIHTLAAAAHQIIHDLGTKQGRATALRGLDTIPPHLKQRVRQTLKKPENFLKHADHDQNNVLDFPPEITEGFILDAVEAYEFITKEKVPLFSTFKLWMCIHKPQIFKKEFLEQFNRAIAPADVELSKLTRPQFYNISLPSFTKLYLGIS